MNILVMTDIIAIHAYFSHDYTDLYNGFIRSKLPMPMAVYS